MNIRPVFRVLGMIVVAVGSSMLFPAAIDLVDGSAQWVVFALSGGASIFFGGLVVLATQSSEPSQLGLKEGFLLTTMAWVIVAAVCAVPFVGVGLATADAFFESMSGLTTTGSTVLVGLDKLPRGILLWRALLHALGGLGIIVMAIVLLPYLRIGGMQLFKMESSDRTDKVVARIEHLVRWIAALYCILLITCGMAFYLLGMSAFDAICHAMATVSTGGFSTHDASFGHFQSPALEWTAILFMIAGALPFALMVKAALGQPKSLVADAQVLGFLKLCFLMSLVLALPLWMATGGDFLDALRRAAFNAVSIITTTGFASEDYTKWGEFSIAMFFLLTFLGGCSGSTSGAIKFYRLHIASLLIRNLLIRLTSPNRQLPLTYNGVRVKDEVAFSVVAFLSMYALSVAAIALVLSLIGLDFVTAISSSAQALGNVGPGLGDVVGPAGNFTTLPPSAKWVLSIAMLLGRLEMFTVLVLLQPEFWR